MFSSKPVSNSIFSSSLSNKAEKLHSPIPPKLAVFVAKTVISYSELKIEFDEKKEKGLSL